MRNRADVRGGMMLSAAAHCAVLLLIVGTWKAAKLAPTRIPGTASGERQMLVFSLGGAPASDSVLRTAATPVKTAPKAKQGTKAAPAVSQNHGASTGAGGSGQSALGDGNITIALVKNHPRPVPDLSSLPHGTAGDVILDATIDAQGKITDLKVAKGFGGSIDQTVIATVQQWTFTPATKDGVPIASEQEILFHYEHA